MIRDPEKVLTSMHARWPDITLAEIGFEDLHTLFKRVSDREGKTPLVINSDDLLSAPEAGLQAYCAAVGIPFVAEAMQWQEREKRSGKNNPTWNKDEHGFHDSLKASTGLQVQKRDYPPLESSAEMMRLYQASLPHYQALAAHKVQL